MNHLLQHTIKHLLFVLALHVPVQATFADHISPEDIVLETTTEVTRRLQEHPEKYKADPGQAKLLARELIVPHFDFDTMSRQVLARYWKHLNPDQQVCFIADFREKFVEKYARILLSYDNQTISYHSAIPDGLDGYILVLQDINLADGSRVVVEYPMRPLEDGWKIIDLVIDGISLVKSHRNAYQQEINNSGLQIFLEESLDCIN